MAKFKANSSGVQIYYWNFGDDPNFKGWVPTLDSSYGHIFYSAGTFYVKLMVTSGMGGSRDTIEKAIYIRPKPTIDVDLEPYSSNGSYCISRFLPFLDGEACMVLTRFRGISEMDLRVQIVTQFISIPKPECTK